ncbi:MAG: DNA repair protein RecN [Lachnospiraceae bacterium]|nr:DNA repair protein RecN [Lachnospiraceae bacterium]
MLQHVRVQNIALIDEASFHLNHGLNVLTGETGAGKSILLGAIQLALGSRADKNVMRDPSKGAFVELLFHEDKKELLEEMENMGISPEGGEILIARRFTPSGRSACMVNDCQVTSAQIRKLAGYLIDIHGQHEHQSLLDGTRHIELLDRFIPDMKTLSPKLRELWTESEKVRKELAYYEESGKDRIRMLSLMEYEINEILEADWKEGEEESLAEEKKKLMYAERLHEAAQDAYGLLNESGYGSVSALSQLDDALAKMKSAVNYDPDFFSPFIDSMGEQISILEDIASEMRDYADRTDADPERLDQVEERISQIRHLKDKYGKDRQQVFSYLDRRREEYEKLKDLDSTIEGLRSRYLTFSKAMNELAEKMTRLRTEAGERISKQITEVLSTLQFEDPLFLVDRAEKPLSPGGKDQITFMIRTNVGEKVLPLNKIASGGEMSRVMLAIKTVLAEEDDIGTMIFDEIDTGISGRTAQSVAEKMSRIAVFHQVICVSHLPQIAAMADSHLRILKQAGNGRTFTDIMELSREDSLEELSRMLGGLEITEAVRENAAEMKGLADKLKTGWK